VSKIPYSELSKLTNKMLVIIKTDYSESLSLKIIAEKFRMNSAYLGQSFLKETKMKFSEYLMVYRLHRAYDLILGSNDKIHYIAKQVGYTNLNYFYVQFRLFFGISPSDLRKS
jgi:YesN/AraC family two-component response regulator